MDGLLAKATVLNELISKESEIKELIIGININRVKDDLKNLKNYQNTVSGIGVASGIGGAGAGVYSLAGIAFVPVVGWALLVTGIFLLGAKAIVDRTTGA
jgi:hypothetical protein